MTFAIHIRPEIMLVAYFGGAIFMVSVALMIYVLNQVQRRYPPKDNVRLYRGVELDGLDWAKHFLDDPNLATEQKLLKLANIGYVISISLMLLATPILALLFP